MKSQNYAMGNRWVAYFTMRVDSSTVTAEENHEGKPGVVSEAPRLAVVRSSLAMWALRKGEHDM
jgi:hypothetical protein